MNVEITMPSLGLTMTEGKVIEWYKELGDCVEEGEPLFLLETEKTTIEINASLSGVLAEIIIPIGEIAPVGKVIAVVETSGEGKVDKAAPSKVSTNNKEPGELEDVTEESPQIAKHVESKFSVKSTAEKVRATPVARRVAQDAGIDLKNITGTGINGVISREDVEKYISENTPSQQSGDAEIEPLSGIRVVIAERMFESSRTTAPVTLSAEADATMLVFFRENLAQEWNSSLGIKPSYNDILVAILAIGLAEFPHLNAHFINNEIHLLDSINIGIAVDTERGLIVPVIKDVAGKKISEITKLSADFISRARSGSLLPDDLTGGTFTLTNLGMYGIGFFTPIINLPETAILGVGKITEVPSVLNGQIEIRKKISLSLTFDHRVIDGAHAARFLQRIVQLIEQIVKESLFQRIALL